MSYKDLLEQFDDVWGATEPMKNEFSPLPDGKYQARIDVARIEENEEYHTVNLAWEFEVTTGEYQGRRIFKRSQLDNEERLVYLKTDLDRLGVKLDRLSDIESVLHQLLDLVVEVYLKTGKPNDKGKTYQNCYINRLVGEKKGDSLSSGWVDVDEKDLPFF